MPPPPSASWVNQVFSMTAKNGDAQRRRFLQRYPAHFLKKKMFHGHLGSGQLMTVPTKKFVMLQFLQLLRDQNEAFRIS